MGYTDSDGDERTASEIHYAWLDSNGIKLVPEFEYDFECREWAK